MPRHRRPARARSSAVTVAMLVVLAMASACTDRAQPSAPPTVAVTSETPSPSPSITTPSPVVTSPKPTTTAPPLCAPGDPLGPAADGSAARITGPLHLCGADLAGVDGRPVRLLSVSYSGMEEGAGLPEDEGLAVTGCPGWRAPTPEDIDNMAGAGFNSIRLAVSWANLEPSPTPPDSNGALRHRYDPRYLEALDAAVKAITARGVAVVLVMHQTRWSPAFRNLPVFGRDRVFCQGVGMPAWLYPDGGGVEAMVAAERSFFTGGDDDAVKGFVDAWTFLADRYLPNPLVVGADLLNEPYDLLTAPYPGVADLTREEMALAALYELVGKAVHAVSPNLVLFVQDNISRRTGLFALTRPPDLANMAYAPHFYQLTWNEEGLLRLNRYLERSLQWGLPLWIGELTRFALDPGWSASLESAVTWAETRDVSWALWSYRSDWFEPGGGQPGLIDVVRSGF